MSDSAVPQYTKPDPLLCANIRPSYGLRHDSPAVLSSAAGARSESWSRQFIIVADADADPSAVCRVMCKASKMIEPCSFDESRGTEDGEHVDQGDRDAVRPVYESRSWLLLGVQMFKTQEECSVGNHASGPTCHRHALEHYSSFRSDRPVFFGTRTVSSTVLCAKYRRRSVIT
jgi:hypothetical protein